MRRIRHPIAHLLVLANTAWADAPPPSGLCAVTETTYFSCLTDGDNWLSLCGRPLGKLQFRKGVGGRLELRYPDDMAAGMRSFQYAHYQRYQTERVEIEFHAQGIDYTLFDYHEGKAREAGLRASLPAGRESERRCIGQTASRLLELETILPCSPDNALNGGRCP
ncbi:hypothetical protein EZJ19_11185 [Parasulfuritortus cantonensis]|uniref:Uncharacterized protein n=1 Tax=Parasulfuritortus cantonensis TaxID=2528202 RepID=A0A4V6NAX7_9PROT|nr:hypothetical protein [Parasulfuritortus cantonensis]TCJ12796.1 hypothetical protein EZJ19_11185 [Parasulfuritortus cantonensis]